MGPDSADFVHIKVNFGFYKNIPADDNIDINNARLQYLQKIVNYFKINTNWGKRYLEQVKNNLIVHFVYFPSDILQ